MVRGPKSQIETSSERITIKNLVIRLTNVQSKKLLPAVSGMRLGCRAEHPNSSCLDGLKQVNIVFPISHGISHIPWDIPPDFL